ncbi:hypothetical protein [Rhodoferax ferrireducens]|uniref:hypothetical protein n=1 Tax=Rhodoferax ferrireducens TaxID=192843 RepID=UPI000E0DBAE9|nr:hypothetical protein [Rhodoferax ferrireducens]
MSYARFRPQQGFAAIAAIFLVVVLAALGGFMLTFSNTQQLTSTQDVQGTRAFWAARVGLEWGVAGVFAQPAATANCVSASQTLPGGVATFDGGFTVVVSCSRQIFVEGGVDRKIFQFTSVASSAGGVGTVGFVERSMSASVER